MPYRLNLYSNARLTSSEQIETTLQEAKDTACAALDNGKAQRAELLNSAGAILFQRWAVL